MTTDATIPAAVAKSAEFRTAAPLLDEAFHLLRRNPALLVPYMGGTVPFALVAVHSAFGLLTDPWALHWLPVHAVALAALFVWMKVCQAFFCRRLTALRNGHEPPPFRMAEAFHAAVRQLAVAPAMLALQAAGVLSVAGAVWLLPFCQNTTVFGADGGRGVRELLDKSWEHASFAHAQAFRLLLFLLLFGVVVFIDWWVFLACIPAFLKIFAGVETVFSRGTSAVFSPGMAAVAACLAWLTLDPLLKATLTLRAFYGRSRTSGEDLLAALRRSGGVKKTVLAAMLLAFTLTAVPRAGAATGPEAPAPVVTAAGADSAAAGEQLDRALASELRRSVYRWDRPEDHPGQASSPFERIADWLNEKAGAISDRLEEFWNRVKKWFEGEARRPEKHGGATVPEGSSGFRHSMFWLLVVLVAGLAGLLGVLACRVLRNRNAPAPAGADAPPAEPEPDVAAEDTAADALPSDGWFGLAAELRRKGDFRLALRALYLGTLAGLAARSLIRIARHKSNADYVREFRRHAHAMPDKVALFGGLARSVNAAWYGMAAVDEDACRDFEKNARNLVVPHGT